MLSHSYLGTARDAAGKGRDMGGWSCVSGMREQACIFYHPSQGVNPAPEFTFLCDGKCDMAAPASLLLALPAGNPRVTSRGCSQRGSCGIQGQRGSSLAGQGMAGSLLWERQWGHRDASRGWREDHPSPWLRANLGCVETCCSPAWWLSRQWWWWVWAGLQGAGEGDGEDGLLQRMGLLRAG